MLVLAEGALMPPTTSELREGWQFTRYLSWVWWEGAGVPHAWLIDYQERERVPLDHATAAAIATGVGTMSMCTPGLAALLP